LIDLWAKVPDQDLLVAGTGEYESELRSKAAGNPRIKFLGALSQRELGALYHHAMACIVPSLTYETFGIVIVESFARKTPVIVRDLGALPEVVNDSGGGCVYQDDEELLTAISRLATEPTLGRQLGERGYKAFLQRWSREAHMDLYFGFLRKTAVAKFGAAEWEEVRRARQNAHATVQAVG
jgi:glycosyltransferase involved in cell wall biosynthesis